MKKILLSALAALSLVGPFVATASAQGYYGRDSYYSRGDNDRDRWDRDDRRVRRSHRDYDGRSDYYQRRRHDRDWSWRRDRDRDRDWGRSRGRGRYDRDGD